MGEASTEEAGEYPADLFLVELGTLPPLDPIELAPLPERALRISPEPEGVVAVVPLLLDEHRRELPELGGGNVHDLPVYLDPRMGVALEGTEDHHRAETGPPEDPGKDHRSNAATSGEVWEDALGEPAAKTMQEPPHREPSPPEKPSPFVHESTVRTARA